MRQKIATEKRDIMLVQKFFRYPNFSETQKGSPTKLMGIVRQKKRENPDIRIIQKFSVIRTFLKRGSVPSRSFWALIQKNKQNPDTPPIQKIF